MALKIEQQDRKPRPQPRKRQESDGGEETDSKPRAVAHAGSPQAT